MRLCFSKLGMPVIGEIHEPGFLEGGDYFPAGPDLALVGIGLRSNMEACQQLMERDLLGARCLAVVKDEFDKHQDRMHLDCVFRCAAPAEAWMPWPGAASCSLGGGLVCSHHPPLHMLLAAASCRTTAA